MKLFLVLTGSVLLSSSLAAQEGAISGVVDRIEKNGCVELSSSRVTLCRYDYEVDGRAVEALSFLPAGQGPFPAVLMIPGHGRAAKDLIPLGTRLAAAQFACLAVSQPGFGKSQGPADFVGPMTIKVLTTGYRKFQKEPFVDPKRMGIYGYSRGAMAASLLAVQLDDVRAAVFGAGVYDFKKAYNDSPLAGIRANMKTETGMSQDAIRQRSSILNMEKLNCPVLVLHGKKDRNVPVSQAVMLQRKLTELHKEFEIKLFPDREHSIGPEVTVLTLDFFNRKLK